MEDFSDTLSGKIFYASASRLTLLARQAIHEIGVPKKDLVLYCIAVDSCWKDVVDKLQPDTNWQTVRDRGLEPLAIGAATWNQIEPLTNELPFLLQAKVLELNQYKVPVLIVHDNGCSVAELQVASDHYLH